METLTPLGASEFYSPELGIGARYIHRGMAFSSGGAGRAGIQVLSHKVRSYQTPILAPPQCSLDRTRNQQGFQPAEIFDFRIYWQVF
jgi:hypothetical protein